MKIPSGPFVLLYFILHSIWLSVILKIFSSSLNILFCYELKFWLWLDSIVSTPRNSSTKFWHYALWDEKRRLPVLSEWSFYSIQVFCVLRLQVQIEKVFPKEILKINLWPLSWPSDSRDQISTIIQGEEIQVLL